MSNLLANIFKWVDSSAFTGKCFSNSVVDIRHEQKGIFRAKMCNEYPLLGSIFE